MHPIGQIFNTDDWREYKNVRIEHMLAPIYIADTSKIDENEDSEIV